MNEHARRDELIALRLGRLSGAESRELLNHVAACAECQAMAQQTLAVDGHGRALIESLSHDDVPARQWSRVARRVAAAAIAAAAVIALMLAYRRPRAHAPAELPKIPVAVRRAPVPPPASITVSPRPEPWAAMVREAVAAGALRVPHTLAALQPSPDQFRTAAEAQHAIAELHPFSEVVETTQPRFRWPPTEGATYVVLIGDANGVVAQSAALSQNSWQPEAPLARGRTYTWQVEVRRGETAVMLPVPPAPRARFHVLEADLEKELARARDIAPDDHLLLGILAARAGLQTNAIEQLRMAVAQGAPGAAALLESVRKWPSARR